MIKSIKYNLTKILLITATILTSDFFTGCQKAPINGELDGQWQVTDTTPLPSVEPDVRLYYNFSLHVCSLSYYGGYFLSGNMTYDEKTLTLHFPFAYVEHEMLDLTQFGIHSNPVTFNVEFKGHNTLILTNEESTVMLRRH